jgi:outer membrane lipoprotein-sorting protein
MFKTPDGKDGGRQYFVSDLEIDPKLDKDTFKINVPDGYETVDDFAP